MENNPEQVTPVKARIGNKPFICNIILAIALTYFLILALLFLAGLIFFGMISDAIAPYLSTGDTYKNHFLLFILSGTVLFFAASAGIILFLLKIKNGFYLFIVAALLLFCLDLVFLQFDWLRYLIHSGFIFILGIAYLSGRCNRKSNE